MINLPVHLLCNFCLEKGIPMCGMKMNIRHTYFCAGGQLDKSKVINLIVYHFSLSSYAPSQNHNTSSQTKIVVHMSLSSKRHPLHSSCQSTWIEKTEATDWRCGNSQWYGSEVCSGISKHVIHGYRSCRCLGFNSWANYSGFHSYQFNTFWITELFIPTDWTYSPDAWIRLSLKNTE